MGPSKSRMVPILGTCRTQKATSPDFAMVCTSLTFVDSIALDEACHRLPPLRSKLQAEGQRFETLRTPAAPSYARESIPKPLPLISKMVHEACAPLEPGP